QWGNFAKCIRHGFAPHGDERHGAPGLPTVAAATGRAACGNRAMTSALLRLVAVPALLALAACMPSPREIRQAQVEVRAEQDTQLTCDLPDHCALSSPLYDLAEQAFSQSTPEVPRHRLVLLENGQDALLARINLIRAAR